MNPIWHTWSLGTCVCRRRSSRNSSSWISCCHTVSRTWSVSPRSRRPGSQGSCRLENKGSCHPPKLFGLRICCDRVEVCHLPREPRHVDPFWSPFWIILVDAASFSARCWGCEVEISRALLPGLHRHPEVLWVLASGLNDRVFDELLVMGKAWLSCLFSVFWGLATTANPCNTW